MKIKGKIFIVLLFSLIISHNYDILAFEIDNKLTLASEYDIDDYYEYEEDASGVYITMYKGNEEVVSIPSYISQRKVTAIYPEAFSYSDTVKKVIIPSTIESIADDSFISCLNLECIEVDENNEVYASYDGVLYSKDWKYLNKCPEGKIGEVHIKESNKYVCDNSFFNCVKITKIYIPGSVYDIGIGAFYQMPSLENIIIDDNNEQYMMEDYILYNKSKTNLIKCLENRSGEFNISEGVTEISDYAFWECLNIEKINFPSSLKVIGNYAFFSCENLKGNLDIPDSVTQIGIAAFYNCKSLNSLIVGNGVKQIEDDTFGDCKNLKEIIISDSVEKICDRAFFGCINTEKLSLGQGLKEIGEWAFDYLTSLKGDLIIPDSVEKINNSAFYHCINLDGYIIIGKNVKEIGASVFSGVKNSKGIIFEGELPIIKKSSFEKLNVPYYYLEDKLGFDNVLAGKDLRTYVEKPIVNFVINDNIYKTVELDSYGKSIEEFENPIESKYMVIGWYYDKEYNAEYNFSDKFMNNTTIYAKTLPINSISFKEENVVLEVGDEHKLDYEYHLLNGATSEDINWKSSNEDIITVIDGIVYAVSEGSAQVTALYQDIEQTIDVQVLKKNTLNIETPKITLQVGNSTIIKYEYCFNDGATSNNIEWSSSDEKVAKVENGQVVAVSEGVAVITASYNKAYSNVEVTVLKNDSIEFKKLGYVININEELEIPYDRNLYNEDYENIKFSSSDEDIVIVSDKCVVTAISAGSATITASYKDIETSVTILVSDNKNILIGDVNSDQKVNATDSALILDSYKYNVFSDIMRCLGDINGDRKINATDAALILDIYKNNINRE